MFLLHFSLTPHRFRENREKLCFLYPNTPRLAQNGPKRPFLGLLPKISQNWWGFIPNDIKLKNTHQDPQSIADVRFWKFYAWPELWAKQWIFKPPPPGTLHRAHMGPIGHFFEVSLFLKRKPRAFAWNKWEPPTPPGTRDMGARSFIFHAKYKGRANKNRDFPRFLSLFQMLVYFCTH